MRSLQCLRAFSVWSFMALSLVAGCMASPTGDNGVGADTYIPQDVATIAAVCASTNFDTEKTRQILISKGFVERRRPLQHQIEKFPVGAKPLTQGVSAPWNLPCKPSVDARYVNTSLAAAAVALQSYGYVTSDGLFFVKDGNRIRLQSRGVALGGPAEINLTPL